MALAAGSKVIPAGDMRLQTKTPWAPKPRASLEGSVVESDIANVPGSSVTTRNSCTCPVRASGLFADDVLLMIKKSFGWIEL
jgi:hypothetical protein